MNYSYGKPVAEEDKLLFFCQLASQYADELDFTDHYESTSEVEYPLIYFSGTHLFRFVMNYSYGKSVAEEDKLLFFCQLASQYADELDFTDRYESTSEVEYPLIYLRQNP
jgi:tRNA isopentenyl-2-thiomethyl-A-37 hydroxylase MiaE